MMMEPLYTLSTLANAAGGTLVGGAPDTPVTGISIDTRTLAPGDAFFAIKGVAMDGHRFIADAHAKGASAAVVRDDRGEGARIIVEGDVLAAMERVGVASRARLNPGATVVAVTGSVGKTGTKEMLRLAFGAGGPVHASAASYNNHWGVPLTLARMPKDVSAAIFEIGMNHAGEITSLTKMVRPQIAIVTTVAAVHLEFFDSVEGIADAKAEIFCGLQEGGTAIIPADNPHTARLKKAAERYGHIVTFGAGEADVQLISYDEDTATAEAEVFGQTVRYRLGAPGRHVADNSLTVLAALHVAGRDVAKGAAALHGFSAPKGRGRRLTLTVDGGEAVLIDEAYNANPASMAAAIASLGLTPATRKVALLGDMLELGDTADALHRGLAPLLIEADARIVHTVGPMMMHLRQALPPERRGHHAQTADEIASLVEVRAGDAVLVKGSNAVGLGQVVDALSREGVKNA